MTGLPSWNQASTDASQGYRCDTETVAALTHVRWVDHARAATTSPTLSL